MKVTVRDATRAVGGQLILGDPRHALDSVVVDSRQIAHDCLFFALKGERVDGHDFALSAWRQGAAGLVVSRLDWLQGESKVSCAVIRVNDTGEALKAYGAFARGRFKGPVVGITGSNGKTTTKQMVAAVLKTRDKGLSTAGNYNSQIGLPIMLSRLADDDRWMVLEMGASAPGHIASLCDIARPTVGILTSIGPAHLATFGSLKRIAETKWELMEALPEDGAAIVPWGVPELEPHVRSYKKRIVFVGENTSCPIRASQVEVGERVRFRLHVGSDSESVTLPLPGRYNVVNALAAAAAGWVLGIKITDIVRGLESFEAPRMRMEVSRLPSGAVIVNDAYNANPASMAQAVHSLIESYPDRRRILVLGSMLELGPDSDRYHFHLGVDVGRCPLDKVFLLGGEMRQVLDGAVSVGAPGDRFVWSERHEDVAEMLRKAMGPDAVVLFKGSRGMKLEKIIEAVAPSPSQGDRT
jgi:UDP-N-acetylmuramoyl-tripeptide--D-alanyl-D-alanine ligase